MTAGVCVANVYLAQPLLDSLASAFRVPPGAIGSVVTATQAGSVLALLLIVPLGDRCDRRRLMLLLAPGLVLALLAVALARHYLVLLAAMAAVGALGTAMTQGLIAYAANAAGPHERGRVVGMTQSGVVVGLLLARVWAGALADGLGWRGVYLASAVLVAGVGLVVWRELPRLAGSPSSLPYLQLLRSTVALLRTDPVLRRRGLLGALLFAVFNIFWSPLALSLAGPPHSLSHAAIGAFGLLGALGALGAGKAGRWTDRGWHRRTSICALLLMAFAWLPLAGMPLSLWSLMLGVVLLDLGCQALHVTNQSLILGGPPESHGRLIACYMLFYAVGSGAGALASTSVYAWAGWLAVCGLGAGVSLFALVFWWLCEAAPRPPTGGACALAP
ncbi:MFS transporter [Xylophilus rhododendri]|uniref:MFS transporter n=1 Tax=Xylophilus rhododendri TaxID=2697032 RepID=UPI002DD8ED07|nr:MFS transporter [Xylophilus rhododendri]